MQHNFPVEIASRPFAPMPSMKLVSSGFDEPGVPQPRFVRSVVEAEGLGRFVYLQGRSGRRYVFSSITVAQAALYENAIFAYARDDGSPIRFFLQEPVAGHGVDDASMFVHILSDGSSAEVLADLTGNPVS